MARIVLTLHGKTAVLWGMTRFCLLALVLLLIGCGDVDAYSTKLSGPIAVGSGGEEQATGGESTGGTVASGGTVSTTGGSDTGGTQAATGGASNTGGAISTGGAATGTGSTEGSGGSVTPVDHGTLLWSQTFTDTTPAELDGPRLVGWETKDPFQSCGRAIDVAVGFTGELVVPIASCSTARVSSFQDDGATVAGGLYLNTPVADVNMAALGIGDLAVLTVRKAAAGSGAYSRDYVWSFYETP